MIATKRLCCFNVHEDNLLSGCSGPNRFFVFNFSEGGPQLKPAICERENHKGGSCPFLTLLQKLVCLMGLAGLKSHILNKLILKMRKNGPSPQADWVKCCDVVQMGASMSSGVYERVFNRNDSLFLDNSLALLALLDVLQCSLTFCCSFFLANENPNRNFSWAISCQ